MKEKKWLEDYTRVLQDDIKSVIIMLYFFVFYLSSIIPISLHIWEGYKLRSHSNTKDFKWYIDRFG